MSRHHKENPSPGQLQIRQDSLRSIPWTWKDLFLGLVSLVAIRVVMPLLPTANLPTVIRLLLLPVSENALYFGNNSPGSSLWLATHVRLCPRSDGISPWDGLGCPLRMATNSPNPDLRSCLSECVSRIHCGYGRDQYRKCPSPWNPRRPQ